MSEQKHESNRINPTHGNVADAQEAAVLQRIIQELTPLAGESRHRILDTVCTFFSVGRSADRGHVSSHDSSRTPAASPSTFRFSEGAAPSPKDFIRAKDPKTDVERVACLAYYLTHHRGTPHFKTKDISDLNTEAAQRRFSNTAFAVVNATNAGYLVPSVKGCKQLSATGEQFVQALPDRDAAKEVQERLKPRKASKRSRKTASRSPQN